MDNDGEMDIVHGDSGLFIPFWGKRSGAYEFIANVWLGYNDTKSVLYIADVTGDELPDLIGLNPNAQKLAVRRNLGNRQFAPVWNVTVSACMKDVVVARIDGDALDDLMILDNCTGVRLMRSNGDGTFTNWGMVAVAGSVSLAAADLNLDGACDLVVGSTTETFHTFLNDGVGGFVATGPMGAANDVNGIALADLNNDSKPDLVVCAAPPQSEHGTGWIQTFIGLGTGSFSLKDSTPLPWRPSRPEFIDLDADGHLDFFGVDSGYRFIARRGDGNGSFGPVRYFLIGGVLDHDFGDVTGDGLVDLLMGPAQFGPVLILENRSGFDPSW